MSVPAGKTKTVPINAATPTAITADIDAMEIDVIEDNSVVGAPTTDLLIYMPDANATPIQWPGGVVFKLRRGGNVPIKSGESPALVKTVSGSTTLAVIQRSWQ